MNEALIKKIKLLKRERRVVFLAHNYQRPDIQDIADFVGDSLGLSRQASETDADCIVFCGVHFMAETAAILSSSKTVLMPDPYAGCPMAEMITAEQLRRLKAEHPAARVVCYVNSPAEVKAESDLCCTSDNAVEVVNSVSPDTEIIFVPDKYLGLYVKEQTGRDMVLWPGYCPTHASITSERVLLIKDEHPRAVVMAHPECRPEVTRIADHVFSTGGMCRFAQSSDPKEFIVCTETGILHRLRKENPGKQFYPATGAAVCSNMKRTTIEKLLWSIEDLRYVVTVSEQIATKARRAIERMMEISE